MFLITGATGNVGREVVSQLLAAGHIPRVFTRSPEKLPQWRNRVEIATGNFSDAESFAGAAKGALAIYLVASGTSADSFAMLLRMARAAGRPRVIFISGSVAQSDYQTGVWFRQGEESVHSSGLPWTILRPGDFMSNALQWAGSIQRESIVYNPTADAKTAPIAPDDVAAAVVKCSSLRARKVKHSI